MPLCRRGVGDPSLSQWWQSDEDDKDNDALIAIASKNEEDHMRSLFRAADNIGVPGAI